MSSKRGNSSYSEGNRFEVLRYDQVVRLNEVMQSKIPVNSREPGWPAINLCLIDLVRAVRSQLMKANIEVRDIRLNGGAASYVIGKDSTISYNDIDLLFGVNFFSNSSAMQKVKTAVLDALVGFLPDKSGQSTEQWNNSFGTVPVTLRESYIHKLVRIYNPDADLWTLIALGNPSHNAKTVELKFVDKMRRQFEFTMDSFQIILDSLLTFYEVETETREQCISKDFYPTMVAESVSGSFREAEYHLNNRLIVTRNPEEIRGGGLFKYCKLLVEGYKPADTELASNMERYMCSRFFIDFPDIHKQYQKLDSYLSNHFPEQMEHQVDYLRMLHWVVANSTVCLMQHERVQSLTLIEQMISSILAEISSRNSVICLDAFNNEGWVLDQVYYGTSHFPAEAFVHGVSTYSACSSSSEASTPCELTPVDPNRTILT